MRSFTSTLLFEQAMDFVPPSNPNVYAAMNAIFNPQVRVIENDCNTLLGEKIDLTLDLIGRYELETYEVIDRDRLNQASNAGQSYLRVRSLSTCISPGGICQKCYQASRPGPALPPIDSFVTIDSLFPLQVEHLVLPTGTTTCEISYAPEQYDILRLYANGFIRQEGVGYTVSGTTVTLTPGIGAEPGSGGAYGTLTLRYLVDTRAPYLYWLASKFSGSLVGLAGLPTQLLPIRKSLHTSVLPIAEVEYLVNQVSKSSLTPDHIKGHLQNIPDPFEKAMFVALLSSIYLS